MGRLLSSQRREFVMPILRYIVWVGASLLALLFVASWFLPEPPQKAVHEAIEKPVIRIASVQRPPTSYSSIPIRRRLTPPPIPLESAISDVPPPLQAYASVNPPPVTADVNRKKPRDLKRQKARIATYQSPSVRTPVVASGNQAAPVPLTKLSFLDIVSGVGKDCSTCIEPRLFNDPHWNRPVHCL